MIRLSDEYLNSSPRIAIVGQEVLDWYYTYPQFIAGEWDYYYADPGKGSVQKAISEYEGFDFAYSKREPRFRHSPFWRFFHEVRKLAFPSEPDAHRKVLWTNLVKFVTKDGSLIESPHPDVEEAIQLQQDVLMTELNIANPEVCLFVTGPKFDDILRGYFRDLGFEQVRVSEAQPQLGVREFARLVHEQLPRHSYRTYHPGFLNRRRQLREEVLQILGQQLAAWSYP